MAVDSANSTSSTYSAWAPLRVKTFRLLWFAQLGSMIGTWMQTVGAQWLLVGYANAATLVSLVQTATMLPTLLLALPAGVLADVYDRRKLLIAVQGFQLAVAATMTGLTIADRMPPALLLTFTFLLGCGQTLTMPGWQALIPELVPRAQLPAASALGGVSQNLARAIGPALAGLLIAQISVAAVFAINAATFAVLAAVLAGWHREAVDGTDLPEHFGSALRAGGRYVRHSPIMRRMLLRSALFVVPGAAVWALLPLVATQLLGLGSGGYGLLLAALGVGAVTGAIVLPRVRSLLSTNHAIMLAGLAYATALVVVAVVHNVVAVAALLVLAGMGWLTVLATLNAAIQLFLPRWVRARGLATYQVVFLGSQGIAAFLWGLIAQQWGLTPTFLAAAVVMAAGALTIRWLPLHDAGHMNRELAVFWPEPHLEFEPDLEEGPVLVVRTFIVPPERAQEFVAVMERVRRSLLRTGATASRLFQDGSDPSRYVEVSVVPTWAEHLRQHNERFTGADQENDERAIALAEGEPHVEHLFPVSLRRT